MKKEGDSGEKVKRHYCTNCGADMVFDPKLGRLACHYCDSSKLIATDPSKIVEQDLSVFLNQSGAELRPLASDALQVTCDSCGATVTFVPPTTATSCDFCAAKLVAQPKAADPLVAPEGVLPFSVEGSFAANALKTWTKTRWFAPNALQTMARHDRAESIYVPYWTFDADTATDYTGHRGEDYQETEHYTDSQGNRRTRTHTRTNWFYASGRVERHFDDTAIPATVSVLPEYLSRLDWDFRELASYDPGYLSGHKAQTYQVTLEEGFERFREIAEGVIRNDVRNDIGGDRQTIDSLETGYSNVTFKHILVPVYAGAYKFKGKTFQVIVNGRTGDVYGERPYSKFKIGCLVFVIILLLIIIFAIFGLFSSGS